MTTRMHSSISLKGQNPTQDPILVRDPFDPRNSLSQDQQRLMSQNNNNNNAANGNHRINVSHISAQSGPHNNNDFNQIDDDRSDNTCCKQCSVRSLLKKVCMTLFGILLVLLSASFFFIPNLIESLLHSHVESALIFTHEKKGNYHYESWKSNAYGNKKTPIGFSISFFNVTNPYDVINGEIPNVNKTEIIIYDANYNRTNVTWDDTKEWSSYDFYVWFVHNAKQSTMSQNETFTIFNPIVGTLYQAYYSTNSRKEKRRLEEVFDILYDLEKKYGDEFLFDILFWRRTAYDLVWSVYDFDNYTIKDYNITIKEHVHWGLMYNNTNQYYTTHTGHNAPHRMSEIKSFGKDFVPAGIVPQNSQPKSEFVDKWNPATTLAPAHLFYFGVYRLYKDKNDINPIWIDILYRNVELEYSHTISKFDGGIEVYSYSIPISPQFDNMESYPPNEQFYQYGPSGVFNCTSAYSGVPIFVSFPYFLGAPEYAQNNSKLGLRKPSDEDNNYINIEPRTGAIFEAKALMQLNFKMNSLPINGSKLSKIANEIMMPAYLIGYVEELNKEQANQLKTMFNLAETTETVSIYAGYVAIPLLVLWGSWMTFSIGYGRGLKEVARTRDDHLW